VFFSLTNPKTLRNTFFLWEKQTKEIDGELRRSYEHNSINYSHSSVNWSVACLAVQPRLGLLSKRRTRFNSFDLDNPGAVGRDLNGMAGRRERIRRFARGGGGSKLLASFFCTSISTIKTSLAMLKYDSFV
jgi:hypothetical protein